MFCPEKLLSMPSVLSKYLVWCAYVFFRGCVLNPAGFGTTALESLPGRIGTQDVADVVAATKAALALEPEALDPSRVGVVGGSHGGFLGAHLTSQHPEIFKVTALRNPVSIMRMQQNSAGPCLVFVEALSDTHVRTASCHRCRRMMTLVIAARRAAFTSGDIQAACSFFPTGLRLCSTAVCPAIVTRA